MKNYLKILVALLLAIACMLSYVSCQLPGGDGTGDGAGDSSGNGTGNGGDNSGGGNTGNVPSGDIPPGDDPISPDDDEVGDNYRVRFVYSYTAKVVNEMDRTDYKKEKVIVGAITVPIENNGFDSNVMKEVEAITYNGYTFVEWYTEWDEETQTGVEGSKYDFSATTINKDITLYGERGNIAGPNLTWELIEIYETSEEENVAAVTDLDVSDEGDDTESEQKKLKGYKLVISGEGPMFDFAFPNEIDVPWYGAANKIIEIEIEDGVTSIGSNAFNGFSKLKTWHIPDSIETIGVAAFANISSKTFRNFECPANLKTIKTNAFYGTGLREVVLNEGLETLETNAFARSSSIKSIIIPSTLKYVGIAAFKNCDVLNKVYYNGNSEDFSAIKVELDNNRLVDFATIYYFDKEYDPEDSESERQIGAFWHYETDSNNKKVAVQNCYTISYVLPSGDKTAFFTQYVPTTPKLDEDGEFVYDSYDLLVVEGVITEDMVKERNSIVYHGYTFDSFGVDAVAAGDIINDDKICTVVRGNILNTNRGLIWSVSGDDNSKTLTISINPEASNASKRTWDFDTSFDTAALWTGNYSTISTIKKIVIQDGVEYLGKYLFAGVSGVKEIVIPTSIKEIHPQAFEGCSGLIAIYYDGEDPSVCKNLLPRPDDETPYTGLVGTDATIFIKVSKSIADDGNYWTLINDAEGTQKRLSWSLDKKNGTLIIGGDSDMIDFGHANLAPWYGAKDSITSVTFLSHITSLGDNVLNGYNKVKTVSLPNGLKYIPESALAGTALLNDITSYENGILLVNGHLLKVDPTRRNTYLFETNPNILTIAGGAFNRCDAIRRIHISSTIQYINAGAFKDTNIEYVFYEGTETGWQTLTVDETFPESVKVLYKSNSKPDEDGKFWYKTGNDYAIWGCAHVWGDWILDSEATCSREGKWHRECIFDNTHVDKKTTEKVPDNHKFPDFEENSSSYTIYSEATCVNNTIYVADCIYHVLGCQEKHYHEIEGTQFEHTWTDWASNNDATCLEDGTKTRTCTTCPDGTEPASETVTDEGSCLSGELKDHSWDAGTSKGDATCVENGHIIFECTNTGCNETREEIEENTKLPHTWGDWVSNNDATCLEDGTKTRTCTTCPAGTTPAAETVTEENTKLDTHTFIEQMDDKYLVPGAVSPEPGRFLYYKSCGVCGKTSDETFLGVKGYYGKGEYAAENPGETFTYDEENITSSELNGVITGAGIDTAPDATTGYSVINVNNGILGFKVLKNGKESVINWNSIASPGANFIFETDIMIDNVSWASPDSRWFRLGFHDNAQNARPLYMYDDGTGFYVTDSADSKHNYNYGEWFNVRIEATSGSYAIYINNVLINTVTDISLAPVAAYFQVCGRLATADVSFDNTYFGKVNYYGKGEYATANPDKTLNYESGDLASSGVSTGGSSALSLTDGKLYVDVHGGSEHSINWTPMQTLTNSFVFETDFMVESGTATDGFVRFGFHNNQTNSRPMLFYITSAGLVLNGATYNYGEWMNIKIIAQGASYSVYINDVHQYTTDGGMQDIVPVVGYMTISRGVSTAKIFFDNTYFGDK